MNEEQADEMISVLKEIKNNNYNLKEELNKISASILWVSNFIPLPEKSVEKYERLVQFKLSVTKDEFYSTLTETQKDYIRKLSPSPIVRTMFKPKVN